MDLGQLARMLSVGAQEEAAVTTDEPSRAEKPSSAWEVQLATVSSPGTDLRLRKSSWRKMVGTVNRMFPIAAQARNRDVLAVDLASKVGALARLRKTYPEVVDRSNLADGMLQAMRKPSTIPQYVQSRMEGKVDARLSVNKHAGALRLAAAATLQAFGITNEAQLRAAVAKMKDVRSVQASVSARALLALATVGLCNTKQANVDQQNLPDFVFSFYQPALGDADAAARVYECAMALIADAPPRKRS